MIERDAYELLSDWKNNDRRRALLLDGARQVGKTYLIERFAEREYPDYVKVDFLRDDEAAAAFSQVRDARQAIEMVGLLAGRGLEAGRTLVFLDEVQEAPNLVTLAKYLVDDGRFDLVMSGSLLGIELRKAKSLPVGYLRIETMYPLGFLEFCRARAVPSSVVDELRDCFAVKRPVRDAVHARMVNLFRSFLVIGGMPDPVQTYLDAAGDLGAVRKKQEDLVELYRIDIAKHAKNRALQVEDIFDALPGQLGKENKRFVLGSLKSDARFEEYANDFAWLTRAKAALKATCVTDPRPMLERTEEKNRFKLYQSDVGMLMSRYRQTVALAALSGARSVNFGAIYENAVAQELAAAGAPLHYYYHSRKGEVDFLVETDDGVVPIEVKSGKDYKRHVALNNLLSSGEYEIERAYVLSEANVSMEKRAGGVVHYLPLYFAPLVAAEAAGASSLPTVPPEVDWSGLA